MQHTRLHRRFGTLLVPRLVLATTLLTVLPLLAPRTIEAATLAAWSQYGEDGVVHARLVTDGPTCPRLKADGKSLPMTERAAPTAAFPVRVCDAPVPVGARHVRAGSSSVPVPVPRPRHIVVFGDTGCRLKGVTVQNCNDGDRWPFRKIAIHAARERPDLMIHVGDYLYRESPCREGDDRCRGTPWGDRWSTWNADFFAPGARLLRQTVWLMARGNHEDCARAGVGWTTLLSHDPIHDPLGTACNPHDSPLFVDLDGVRLAVLDDSAATDKQLDRPLADVIARDIAAAMAAKSDWLVTHHPFRGIAKPDTDEDDAGRSDGKSMEGANPTLLAALSGTDEAPISLMLAGHIHNFQIDNFEGTAPQLVVGEGGDDLDMQVPPRLTGLTTGGRTVTQGMSLPGFGYVVMDRIGQTQNWRITVHAADGRVLRHCGLEARRLDCTAVG